jgi:hypothetical protein
MQLTMRDHVGGSRWRYILRMDGVLHDHGREGEGHLAKIQGNVSIVPGPAQIAKTL